MSNVHRIMWFDQEIRQQRYPNCRALAKRFEISLRQANRDLEYLKNTLDAPVKYIASRRGFIYEDMTFILPNLIITAEEKKALSFLAHRYDNFDGTVNNQRIAKLFRSLSEPDEVNSQTPIFDISDRSVALFNSISLCIRNRRKIDVSYVESGGETIRMILHPYQLYGKADKDYLIAYSEASGDVAIFRFDRLVSCTETKQRFMIKEDYKPENYGSILRKKPFKAKIQMEKSGMIPSYLGDKLTRLDDTIYEVEFYDTEQLIRDLLIINCWSRIISPSWLKDRLSNRCMNIINKLADTELV